MSDINSLIEYNRPYMELIWKRVPKTVKGDVEYIVYEGDDVPALYESGLVDTERYSFKQWEAAFEDCRGEFGQYWVSHEKMISLGQFRFCKIVSEPFDPLRVRTGKYSVTQLWQLFDKAIIPSCALDKNKIKEIFNALFLKRQSVGSALGKELEVLEDQGEDTTALANQAIPFKTDETGEPYVEVGPADLQEIKTLLDTYPSARRKLEMGVQELRHEKLSGIAKRAEESQKSNFEEGKDFRKTTQEDLQNMLVKTQGDAVEARAPKDEVLDLKSLQKRGGLKKKM